MFVDRVRLDAPVEGYAATLRIVDHLAATPLEFRTPVTVFTGDNGSGKSTLVEAIAVARGANPEGGSRHANFATTDSVSRLWQALTITRSTNPHDVFFLRGETYTGLVGYYRSIGEALSDLDCTSHGQGLMRIFRERFGTSSLFVLDEPEDGLSIFAQLELLGLLWHLAEAGSQIIMATHSPILLGIPDATLLHVGDSAITSIPFEKCEAVTAYREFIADPTGTARYLIGEHHMPAAAALPLTAIRRLPEDETHTLSHTWVRDVAAVRHLTTLGFTHPITIITGDNGVGKSTLLEAIATQYGFPRTGGAYTVSTTGPPSPLATHVEITLSPHAKQGYFLRGDTHFDAATQLGDAGPSAHNLHDMSHGESVMLLVEHFIPDAVYLLDEPESGLSAVRQMALLAMLHELAASGAQIIMVTHSPILLAIPDAEIIEITDQDIAREVNLEATTTFRAMRDYLADPTGIAQYMLDVTRARELTR